MPTTAANNPSQNQTAYYIYIFIQVHLFVKLPK